jgi:hypothetical protein
MRIKELEANLAIANNDKLKTAYLQFEKLLVELRKRELPDGIVTSINKEIEKLNSITDLSDVFKKTLKKSKGSVIKLLEKQIKLVPKKYYRNLWLSLGTGIFGIPIGFIVAKGAKNMALIGVGMPIGSLIGAAVGERKDRKALAEGTQLDVDIWY